ncbi:unnamed protein product [Sphagnum balticum]
MVTLEKALKRVFRKAFNRIIYIERKKTNSKYIPQLNILHLLEEREGQLPEIVFNNNLEDFYRQIDAVVESSGRKEPIVVDIENEVVKFTRKNPTKQV